MGMAKHSLKKKIIVSGNQKICPKSKASIGRFYFETRFDWSKKDLSSHLTTAVIGTGWWAGRE